ncbi:MAG: GNAT family N-acetyltransferase, partial [Planctomycetales bacterium]|nr:GNAT family N-acetyltransferase [Planctomycetales bacterium]
MSNTLPTSRERIESGRIASAPSRSASNVHEPLHMDLGDGAELVAANAGDHALIHELLLAVVQGPSAEEFQATIEDPLYEPRDRLLVKRHGRLISHVHVTKRSLHYGRTQLPLAEIQRLTTLPEYRRAGYARKLLEVADEQMRLDGAVVAMLRTTAPEIFETLGWLPCGRPSYYQVGARELRAALEGEHKKRKGLATRMWRHVELAALMQLYDESTALQFGPLVRSEAYWRWLIGRKAYGQILVAIEGDDSLEFGEQAPQIVGYAVCRGQKVVELCVQNGRKSVARELLMRACREAIERDVYSLLVYVPPTGPLGPLLNRAGAKPDAASCRARETLMINVLDRGEVLRRLYDEFYERANQVGMTRPAEFGVEIGGRPHRLLFTRRSVHLHAEEPTRIDMRCSDRAFDALLVGLVDWSGPDAATIEFRTEEIRQLFMALFPTLSIWRPQ